ALGHWSRIAIERRRTIPAIPRPKPRTDHLMRISLSLNLVRPRPRRSRPPRKPGHRQVEAPPEKMHRTHLAQKPRSPTTKHFLRLRQHLPEALCILRVIRLMLRIQIEP